MLALDRRMVATATSPDQPTADSPTSRRLGVTCGPCAVDHRGATARLRCLIGCRTMRPRLGDLRQPLPAIGPLSGKPLRLFLTSATVLFVELLLIRWIPANVKYVGFFSNFLLMASFLGIGVGILRGRRGERLFMSPFAPLLLA